jgi:hypothetical protein
VTAHTIPQSVSVGNFLDQNSKHDGSFRRWDLVARSTARSLQ